MRRLSDLSHLAAWPRVEVSNHRYAADAPWYEEYRRIKYEVFGVEQGWEVGGTACDPLATVDPSDEVSSFTVLRQPGVGALGTSRACRVHRRFPHRDLFASHLEAPAFCGATAYLCTVNGTAVLPRFRGVVYASGGCLGSAGQLLVLSQLEHQRAGGALGALLTASGARSARFFARLGFVPLDAPVATGLHTNRLMNMALWFHSPKYQVALAGIRSEASPAAEIPAMARFADYVSELGVPGDTDLLDW